MGDARLELATPSLSSRSDIPVGSGGIDHSLVTRSVLQPFRLTRVRSGRVCCLPAATRSVLYAGACESGLAAAWGAQATAVANRVAVM